MKNQLLALIILVLIGVASSCKKDDMDSKALARLDQSYKRFLSFKASSNNTYKYVVKSASIFGFSSETAITVEKGKVVSRKYIATQSKNNGEYIVTQDWHEEGAELGTHEQGAALVTLDEIYERSKKEWLKVSTKNNSVYFEANNNGMISLCGHVPNGCMDDCFNGITITSIKAL